MKKKLQTIAVGALLLSGFTVAHDADAKSYKETRLNYLDKNVIKKVKAGKINTLDGYKLGTSLKILKKDKTNSYLFVSDNYQMHTNTLARSGSENTAIVDLCNADCEATNVITRLIDNVVFDANQDKLTRTRLLKLYGTPSKSNQQYIKDVTGDYRIDYYKFATFVYKKSSFEPYTLLNVQYFGKQLKQHPDRFKRLAKYSIVNYSGGYIIDDAFSLNDWETI